MPFPRADAEVEMKISTWRDGRCPVPNIRGATRGVPPAGVGAFTLIELLVVIVIVSVLMGIAFPAFQGVMNSTKKTQARNDLVQIVTAVNAFYTEYGKYPLVTADTTYGTAGPPNNLLFDVLRAKNTAENPRQIIFISPPDVKNAAKPQAGIGTNPANAGQFFDPWGTPYHVRIDGNYDNQVANPFSANAGSESLQAGVIAWSFGKDAASDSTAPAPTDKNTSKNKDDVISWQ
jgi:prepilin-type N-terminal cleavage/methylation domain-containing protein